MTYKGGPKSNRNSAVVGWAIVVGFRPLGVCYVTQSMVSALSLVGLVGYVQLWKHTDRHI